MWKTTPLIMASNETLSDDQSAATCQPKRRSKNDTKTGEELPRTEDKVKAEAAAIFYERYVTARQHPQYVRQKKEHQKRYEGKK